MANEDVAFVWRDGREHGLQLVDQPVECPGARSRFAPGEAGAIVRADVRECRDVRLYNCPTQGGCRDARFEQDDGAAGARARDVQAMAADIDEAARRSETAALSSCAEVLIE